ncbi:4-coumarate--CoA ligase-like 9 isoform X1 [Ziziphus jujuba]|uniref:4-coumarate--CoA ligase-like 9 isoform X1 n=1 Tax=Ziziphus jujuba TaxID=326968 RepID=A0A6P3ZJG6_ZIZJJ|nr:4-coumarate--CoA ligase-like 9 isoform X1 [Ziziphus jujuba]XP_060672323.1 4-coumarate--CoA ligase-like 9 isoform X1 [Ziziphus jujuba]
MDHNNPQPAIDPRSGFNSETKIFHSLRPPIHLPPEHFAISAAAYALSLRRNLPWPDSVALIDSSTGQHIYYSELTHRINTLAANLQTTIGLSKGDTAFILSPNSTTIPILYFSLLTLGVVISPANPLSTESEIMRLIGLCKPIVAFSTSAFAHKLSKLRPKIKIIIIDSHVFDTMTKSSKWELEPAEVRQSDLASIMYSSGTTGKVKGVMSTHRNLIAMIATYHAPLIKRESPAVFIYTVPYFHMFGFFYCARSVSVSDTVVVVMGKFDVRKTLRAVEEFKVTHMMLVPPVVVAMVKSNLTAGYDLSSLEQVTSGAAPLGKDVITAFKSKFPDVVLAQGYGMTEVTGAAFRTINREETERWGSTGRLSGGFEAKIVDAETGKALFPCQEGELWLRGPSIMKGYMGDKDTETTWAAIVSGGWLRTGDLCYIDEEGFLYVVDRLKELIKYKGYQVTPAELEQLLQTHPEIVDAAVIPYPDEEAGQLPMAVVVRQSKSTIGEADVINFVASKVAPYKKVRRVVFVEVIPKSAAGKILRKDLRKIFVPGYLSRL